MPTKFVGIRVPEGDLAEIDRRAQAAGLTRTAFLIRSALQTHPASLQAGSTLEQRLAAVELRLAALEAGRQRASR